MSALTCTSPVVVKPLSASRRQATTRETWSGGAEGALNLSLVIDQGAGMRFSRNGGPWQEAAAGFLFVRDRATSIQVQAMGPPFPQLLTASISGPADATLLARSAGILLENPGRQRIQTLLEWLLDLLRSRVPDGADMASRVARLLVESLVAAAAGQSAFGVQENRILPTSVARALLLMKNHRGPDGNGETLAAIARNSGMSQRTMRRMFADLLEISPREAFNRIRVRHAASLIRSSSRTLADIATATGFFDQGHLCRSFKKCYGLTPNGFRQNPSIPVDRVPDPLAGIPEAFELVAVGVRELDENPSLEEMESGIRAILAAQDLPEVSGTWVPLNLGRARRSWLRSGPRPWLRSGLLWHHLPTGRIHVHGVPVWLTEESPENPGAAVLPSDSTDEAATVDGFDIDLKHRCFSEIAMLHACAYAEAGPGRVAKILILDDHGGSHSVHIHILSDRAAQLDNEGSDAIVSDWWPHARGCSNASSKAVFVTDPDAPFFDTRRCYLWRWQNPQPDVPLAKFCVRPLTRSASVNAILGISARRNESAESCGH